MESEQAGRLAESVHGIRFSVYRGKPRDVADIRIPFWRFGATIFGISVCFGLLARATVLLILAEHPAGRFLALFPIAATVVPIGLVAIAAKRERAATDFKLMPKPTDAPADAVRAIAFVRVDGPKTQGWLWAVGNKIAFQGEAFDFRIGADDLLRGSFKALFTTGALLHLPKPLRGTMLMIRLYSSDGSALPSREIKTLTQRFIDAMKNGRPSNIPSLLPAMAAPVEPPGFGRLAVQTLFAVAALFVSGTFMFLLIPSFEMARQIQPFSGGAIVGLMALIWPALIVAQWASYRVRVRVWEDFRKA